DRLRRAQGGRALARPGRAPRPERASRPRRGVAALSHGGELVPVADLRAAGRGRAPPRLTADLPSKPVPDRDSRVRRSLRQPLAASLAAVAVLAFVVAPILHAEAHLREAAQADRDRSAAF